MNVLVTGGTGFTGKALVQRLLRDRHNVTALDYKEGLKTNELREQGAEVIIGSVVDKDVVTQCCQGKDIVFHLAAAFRELNVPKSFYEQVNIQGTRNVLIAAMNSKVKKLIYCSTCGVHGNIDHPPGNEDAPIKPADYYQRTKYEAEQIVRHFNEKRLKCTILRPAAIYGPGDPERFLMIFKRVKRGVFPMFGSGKTLYHPLYIDNLVEVLILAMEPGKGEGNAYLIADEEYVSIETLVKRVAMALNTKVRIPHFPIWPVVAMGHACEKVCKPLGVSPPIFPRRVDWFRQNRAFIIDKARSELGYQPSIGLDEGLQRTAKWYLGEGYLR